MRADSFHEFVLDQLRSLDRITCRPMFGSAGLYQRDRFFGILFKGHLYFKTDAATRSDYEAEGMKPFRPSAQQTLKRYYEVPANIIETPDLRCEWAERAIACQTGIPKKRRH